MASDQLRLSLCWLSIETDLLYSVLILVCTTEIKYYNSSLFPFILTVLHFAVVVNCFCALA